MTEKTLFNRVGISIALYIAIAIGVQYLLSWIIGAFFPILYYKELTQWLLSLIPMYVVALPVSRAVLKTLPERKLYQNEMRPGKWIQMFLILMALMYIGNIIGTIITSVLGSGTGLDFTVPVEEMISGSNLLSVFVFSVLLTPLVEEYLFRKLLIDRLIVTGDKTAIIVTSLIFAVMHGNISQFCYTFAVGLALAYVYIRTGKMRYNVGLHMLFNFCGGFIPAVFMKYVDIDNLLNYALQGNLSGLLYYAGPLLGFMVYELCMIAMGIAGLVLLVSKRRQIVLRQGELPLRAKEVAKQFFTTPGMLLWIVGGVVLFALNIG